MNKLFNAILRLRRDNDYNYDKIGDSFIPAKGEVCLVDTARAGLRAKIGDGHSTYNQLDYVGEFIVKGYYKDGGFYKDQTLSEPITAVETSLYIDTYNGALYYYSGTQFVALGGNIPKASESNPGIMKLYQTTGQNIDGTMSQKAITDELGEKFEITLNIGEETIYFTQDLY